MGVLPQASVTMDLLELPPELTLHILKQCASLPDEYQAVSALAAIACTCHRFRNEAYVLYKEWNHHPMIANPLAQGFGYLRILHQPRPTIQVGYTQVIAISEGGAHYLPKHSTLRISQDQYRNWFTIGKNGRLVWKSQPMITGKIMVVQDILCMEQHGENVCTLYQAIQHKEYNFYTTLQEGDKVTVTTIKVNNTLVQQLRQFGLETTENALAVWYRYHHYDHDVAEIKNKADRTISFSTHRNRYLCHHVYPLTSVTIDEHLKDMDILSDLKRKLNSDTFEEREHYRKQLRGLIPFGSHSIHDTPDR